LASKGVDVSNVSFYGYADLIENMPEGGMRNWYKLGFSEDPYENNVSVGYGLAEYLIDNVSEFPGIGLHSLDCSGMTTLKYLPSCEKLGVDKDNITKISFWNCKDLEYIADDSLGTATAVIDASTFYNCISLKKIPYMDISLGRF
jgi:hypothetical protein